jgi:hypothetical protein
MITTRGSRRGRRQDGVYSTMGSEYNESQTGPAGRLVPGLRPIIQWGIWSTRRYRHAEMASTTPCSAYVVTLNGDTGEQGQVGNDAAPLWCKGEAL